jgi:putative MATE family efflux protein
MIKVMVRKDKMESSSQPESVIIKNWTEGSIMGNLLLLSWPMVVVETLYMIGQVADMIWVGKLGPSSIAGVGLANICILVVMSMDIGLIMGMRALIARFVGAGDIRGANNTAGQAIILGAGWGIMVGIIGLIAVKPIMGLFGAETEVVTEGVAYLRIILVGWVSMGILVMGLYSVQASGDTVRPMIIEILIRTLHVALCPFLVLGWWKFPHLGVTGAALSNVIAHSLGAMIAVSLLFSGHTRLCLTLSDFRPALNIIWRIMKIGIPALILRTQKSMGDLALVWLIVPFGTWAVAAHSLVLRVEMFFLGIGLGLGGGAGVLVGQNLGAGRPKRAEKSGWMAAGLMEVSMIAFSLMIWLRAENIVGIFTAESDLVTIGSIFLRIATVGYLVFGLVIVFQDCIAGAGDTLPTMIVSIAMIWVIQLPLAFFLPRVGDLGVFGVRWAIVISLFAGAFFYLIYFIFGRWKTKKV